MREEEPLFNLTNDILVKKCKNRHNYAYCWLKNNLRHLFQMAAINFLYVSLPCNLSRIIFSISVSISFGIAARPS